LLSDTFKDPKRSYPEQLPLPELADDDEWEVEEIKDDQRFEDELHYLVNSGTH
jgi:hypothetical protein